MIVYEIIGSYFDGCNNWDWSEGLFIDKNMAEYKCLELMDARLDKDTPYCNYYDVATVKVNMEVL